MDFGTPYWQKLPMHAVARLRLVRSKLLWHAQEHPERLPEIIWKNLVIPFTDESADRRFDWSFGVDTKRFTGDIRLASEEQRAGAAIDYDPTPPNIARHLISQVAHRAHGFTFVDFGAGKGRVMIVAARFPFSRVLGVEWSSPLHLIAQANIAKVASEQPALAPMEVLLGNAITFALPTSPSVFYFFNPFDPETTRRVAQNIARSLESWPRKAFVISYSPPIVSRIFSEELKVQGVRIPVRRQKRFSDFEALVFETCEGRTRAERIFRPLDAASSAESYALLYVKPGSDIECDLMRGLATLEQAQHAARDIQRAGGTAEMIFEELGPKLELHTAKSQLQALLHAIHDS